MKSCFCPNCGKRQSVRLETPSKILLPCPDCGKQLLIKMDKGKFSVSIEEHTSNMKANANMA